MGVGHVGVLTMEGNIAAWGQNNAGQLGINTSLVTAYPRKTYTQVADLVLGGYHTAILKTDETVYVTRIWFKWRNAELEVQEIY